MDLLAAGIIEDLLHRGQENSQNIKSRVYFEAALEIVKTEDAVDVHMMVKCLLALQEFYKHHSLYNDEVICLEMLLGIENLDSECNEEEQFQIRYRLATVYQLTKHLDKALEMLESFESQQTKLVKSDSKGDLLRIHRTRQKIGEIYYELGDYSKAESIFLQLLEESLVHYGESHRVVFMLKESLAKVYAELGRYTEALEIFKELIESFTSMQEVSVSDIFHIKYTLAHMQYLYGYLDDADKTMSLDGQNIEQIGKSNKQLQQLWRLQSAEISLYQSREESCLIELEHLFLSNVLDINDIDSIVSYISSSKESRDVLLIFLWALNIYAIYCRNKKMYEKAITIHSSCYTLSKSMDPENQFIYLRELLNDRRELEISTNNLEKLESLDHEYNSCLESMKKSKSFSDMREFILTGYNYCLSLSKGNNISEMQRISESVLNFYKDRFTEEFPFIFPLKSLVQSVVTESIINPWSVEGEGAIDYSKLIAQFGVQRLTSSLLNVLMWEVGQQENYALRRNLFYSHRDLDILLQNHKNGQKFALYTGRGPSAHVHIAHYFIWKFCKWLQDVFDVEMYFQITDEEKFVTQQEKKYEVFTELAYENMKDIMAIGFDPKKTYFILNSAAGPGFRQISTSVGKHITFSTAKSVFGFDNSTNLGLISYISSQSAVCFYPSYLKGRTTQVLIPAAIDQDPYWRVARDVTSRVEKDMSPGKKKHIKYLKPAAIHSKFLSSLEGDQKMSASSPLSTLFVTDTPKLAKKKINRAFTGGRDTAAEQRELGANPDICPIFSYYEYLFEEDDNELKERENVCRSGKLLCGDCKKDLIGRVDSFLIEHQSERELHTKASLQLQIIDANKEQEFLAKRKVDI